MAGRKDDKLSDEELFRMLGGDDDDRIIRDDKRERAEEAEEDAGADRPRKPELSDEDLLGLITEQEQEEQSDEEEAPAEPELPDPRDVVGRSPQEIMDDRELEDMIGDELSESDFEIAEPPEQVAEGGRATRGGKADGKVRAVIDLHGLTSDAAIEELKAEMKKWKSRPGVYRVIVGKGNHSPDGKGILRERVFKWLEDEGGAYLAGERRWGKRAEGGRGVIVLRIKDRPARKE